MGVFEPFQFQKEAVAKALEQPRVRLLLADDVGLGKTIQVGMILSELARRGRAARILVLAKKSMLNQFQAELWNRFTIPLTRLDSVGIARLRRRIPLNKNPFEIFQRVIISIDTLKTSQYRHFLEKTKWDVVVIDEAHNVAGASVPERHLSHKLAQLLANTAENLLLTTATPHNGKARTFGQLISLLEPSAIADPNLTEYSADDIKPYFLMRFKEDIRSQLSEHLQEREVVPLAKTTAPASAEEEKVFEQLSKIREFTKNGGRQNTLLEYGIYKLFLSSPDACRVSLEKRLKELAKTSEKEDEESLLLELKSALGKQSLRGSTRFATLLRELKEIGIDCKRNSPRVVIFTEFRETQNALALALAEEFGIGKPSFKEDEQPKQPIAVMHGSFSDTGLSNLVESFATGNSPIRVLIATDVASEGINLHHQCNQLIHYDLPWSIITTIQRNGRIDRFGQKEKPYIRYLISASQNPDFFGDMQIFEKLIEKVEQINHTRTAKESVLKLYDEKKEEA
ncbi:helicase, partial [bacterium]|nr:helicase [bacterium]